MEDPINDPTAAMDEQNLTADDKLNQEYLEITNDEKWATIIKLLHEVVQNDVTLEIILFSRPRMIYFHKYYSSLQSTFYSLPICSPPFLLIFISLF